MNSTAVAEEAETCPTPPGLKTGLLYVIYRYIGIDTYQKNKLITFHFTFLFKNVVKQALTGKR
jgi:hypothetical protein